MTNKKNYRILIICTGNSCRSQIAEGFFRSLGYNIIEVMSAGITAHGLNPLAIKTMSDIGIDISAHESDDVAKYLDQSFDYVITVCENAEKNCPVFPGKVERLHWPFEDPAIASGTKSEKLAVFAEIRDQIGRRVELFISKLS